MLAKVQSAAPRIRALWDRLRAGWSSVGRAPARPGGDGPSGVSFDRRAIPETVKASLQTWLALLVAAYVCTVFLLPVTLSSVSYDEEFFVWAGWSLRKGLVPYREFFDFKPPMIAFTYAFALKVFGLAGQHYRYFFYCLALGSQLLLTLALIRAGVRRVLAVVTVVTFTWLYANQGYHDSSIADAESIGMGYYVIGLACLLMRTERVRLWRFFGGVFLALSAASKEPFVLPIFFTWAAFGFRDTSSPWYRSKLLYARDTLLGVGTAAGLIVGYLAIRGGLPAYIQLLRWYGPFSKQICITIGLWKPTASWQETVETIWHRMNKALFNFQDLAGLLPALFAALFIPRPGRRAYAILSFLAAASAAYATTLGHCFFKHYYVLGMSGLFFMAVVGLEAMSYLMKRASPALARWFTALVLMLCVGGFLPVFRSYYGGHYEATGPTSFQPDLKAFVVEHTKPDDYIFTTGAPGLYVYSDRRSAVRESAILDEFLMLYPGNTDEEKLSAMRAELVSHMPKVVVLSKAHWLRKQRHLAALLYPFLSQFGYRKISEEIYVLP